MIQYVFIKFIERKSVVKKRDIFSVLLLTFFFIPSIVFSYFIIIDEAQNRVPVVYFDHSKHLNKEYGLGFPCKKCHHELKTPEQMPTACTACHTRNKTDDDAQLVEKNLPPRLKVAFHNLCRGCHTELKRKYKGVPPTSECGRCHIKELEKFIKEKNSKSKD